VLGALGIEVALVASLDARAMVAARRLCGDDTVAGLDTGEWEDRFARLGDTDVPRRMLWRAGRYNRLTDRPACTAHVNVAAVFDAAPQIEHWWAWTGALAADAITGRPTGVAWLTAYAANPDAFRLAAICVSDEADGPTVPLSVFPATPAARAGAFKTRNGQRFVAPLQAAIDCYAGTGRMPDQAIMLLDQIGIDDGA
jgi:hypothetical protein